MEKTTTCTIRPVPIPTSVSDCEYFESTNRKFEQFLYMHRIYYCSMRKTADNLTCWAYEMSPNLIDKIKEFNEIYSDC